MEVQHIAIIFRALFIHNAQIIGVFNERLRAFHISLMFMTLQQTKIKRKAHTSISILQNGNCYFEIKWFFFFFFSCCSLLLEKKMYPFYCPFVTVSFDKFQLNASLIISYNGNQLNLLS